LPGIGSSRLFALNSSLLPQPFKVLQNAESELIRELASRVLLTWVNVAEVKSEWNSSSRKLRNEAWIDSVCFCQGQASSQNQIACSILSSVTASEE
jgi:hypothetical protein